MINWSTYYKNCSHQNNHDSLSRKSELNMKLD